LSTLTAGDYGRLARVRALRSCASIAIDILGVALLFALPVWLPHPVTWVCCFLMMSRQQHALGILMHEAVHGLLFSSPRANDWVGRWLLGAPLCVCMDSFRFLHLTHHQYTMTERDPDLDYAKGFPVSRRKLMISFAIDLSGVVFPFVMNYVWRGPKQSPCPGELSRRGVLPALVTNALLFTILWKTGHPGMYLGLWIAPLVFLLPLGLHLRGITEHGGLIDGEGQAQSSRTVVNPLQAFFLAPHHFNYHMEHHAHPGVPHFNLPAVQSVMRESGELAQANLFRSYGAVISQLTN
jgi:fatty acid desaturase